MPAPPESRDAYQFGTELSMEAMRDRLNRSTAWHWREGDSGWVGDYLAAEVIPGGSLRLYQELNSTRFVIQMRRAARSDAGRALMLSEILPLLEACDITPTEAFD